MPITDGQIGVSEPKVSAALTNTTGGSIMTTELHHTGARGVRLRIV